MHDKYTTREEVDKHTPTMIPHFAHSTVAPVLRCSLNDGECLAGGLRLKTINGRDYLLCALHFLTEGQ